MEINLIPYSFSQCISDFKGELLYLGSTYYEHFQVFEHLNTPIVDFWGIPITHTELYFSKEKLVAISIYLNECLCNKVKVIDLIEDYFSTEATEIKTDILSGSLGNTIYTWKGKNYKLALLSSLEKDQFFINFSYKSFKLFW